MTPSARDREMAEKWYGEHFFDDGSAVIGIDELARVIARARAEEREACAKVADEFYEKTEPAWAEFIAAALRARAEEK